MREQNIEISKYFLKHGSNGYIGVIGYADSEYEIFNNTRLIFVVVYNYKVNNSSNFECQR